MELEGIPTRIPRAPRSPTTKLRSDKQHQAPISPKRRPGLFLGLFPTARARNSPLEAPGLTP